jgi:two-component system, NarL family, nitrate/nitrite response regulator NarL
VSGSARLEVVVADDHPVYRDGVVSALRRRAEIEVVAELGGGADALAAIRELAPDVAVLDFQMPGLDGVAVAAAVSRDGLPTRTLFLSAYYDRQIVYDALAAGAGGFLSKDAKGIEISDAVLAVARGETVLGGDIQALLAAEIRRAAARDGPTLTARESEVLRLVADGLSAPDIARSLHLGTTTVKTHLQRVYEKLGVTDRAAAVAEAMRRNLLE